MFLINYYSSYDTIHKTFRINMFEITVSIIKHISL